MIKPKDFLQNFKTDLETAIATTALSCPVRSAQLDPLEKDLYPPDNESVCYLSLQPVDIEVSEDGCFDTNAITIEMAFISHNTVTIQDDIKIILDSLKSKYWFQSIVYELGIETEGRKTYQVDQLTIEILKGD